MLGGFGAAVMQSLWARLPGLPASRSSAHLGAVGKADDDPCAVTRPVVQVCAGFHRVAVNLGFYPLLPVGRLSRVPGTSGGKGSCRQTKSLCYV